MAITRSMTAGSGRTMTTRSMARNAQVANQSAKTTKPAIAKKRPTKKSAARRRPSRPVPTPAAQSPTPEENDEGQGQADGDGASVSDISELTEFTEVIEEDDVPVIQEELAPVADVPATADPMEGSNEHEDSNDDIGNDADDEDSDDTIKTASSVPDDFYVDDNEWRYPELFVPRPWPRGYHPNPLERMGEEAGWEGRDVQTNRSNFRRPIPVPGNITDTDIVEVAWGDQGEVTRRTGHIENLDLDLNAPWDAQRGQITGRLWTQPSREARFDAVVEGDDGVLWALPNIGTDRWSSEPEAFEGRRIEDMMDSNVHWQGPQGGEGHTLASMETIESPGGRAYDLNGNLLDSVAEEANDDDSTQEAAYPYPVYHGQHEDVNDDDSTGEARYPVYHGHDEEVNDNDSTGETAYPYPVYESQEEPADDDSMEHEYEGEEEANGDDSAGEAHLYPAYPGFPYPLYDLEEEAVDDDSMDYEHEKEEEVVDDDSMEYEYERPESVQSEPTMVGQFLGLPAGRPRAYSE